MTSYPATMKFYLMFYEEEKMAGSDNLRRRGMLNNIKFSRFDTQRLLFLRYRDKNRKKQAFEECCRKLWMKHPVHSTDASLSETLIE